MQYSNPFLEKLCPTPVVCDGLFGRTRNPPKHDCQDLTEGFAWAARHPEGRYHPPAQGRRPGLMRHLPNGDFEPAHLAAAAGVAIALRTMLSMAGAQCRLK